MAVINLREGPEPLPTADNIVEPLKLSNKTLEALKNNKIINPNWFFTNVKQKEKV